MKMLNTTGQPRFAFDKSTAGYDRAAFLATISDDIACGVRDTFEIVILVAAAIETLGTETITELFGGDRQMTAPATKRGFSLRE